MIEVPRYVHRDGASQLVETVSDLRVAEAEGWRVNPNEPDVTHTVPESLRFTGSAGQWATLTPNATDGLGQPFAAVAASEPIVEAPEPPDDDQSESESPDEGTPSEDAPVVPEKKKRGRPKKGG